MKHKKTMSAKPKYSAVTPACLWAQHPGALNKYGNPQLNDAGPTVTALISNSNGMGAMLYGYIYDQTMAERIVKILNKEGK